MDGDPGHCRPRRRLGILRALRLHRRHRRLQLAHASATGHVLGRSPRPPQAKTPVGTCRSHLRMARTSVPLLLYALRALRLHRRLRRPLFSSELRGELPGARGLRHAHARPSAHRHRQRREGELARLGPRLLAGAVDRGAGHDPQGGCARGHRVKRHPRQLVSCRWPSSRPVAPHRIARPEAVCMQWRLGPGPCRAAWFDRSATSRRARERQHGRLRFCARPRGRSTRWAHHPVGSRERSSLEALARGCLL